MQEITMMAFEVYGKQLKTVPSFEYLGRILTAGDNDWPVVAGNLGKARKSWGRLKRILSWEGADKRLSRKFSRRCPTGTPVWGGDVDVDAKNREVVELIHVWGRETDHRETAAERVGREMFLPLPGGGHEGSRI